MAKKNIIDTGHTDFDFVNELESILSKFKKSHKFTKFYISSTNELGCKEQCRFVKNPITGNYEKKCTLICP